MKKWTLILLSLFSFSKMHAFDVQFKIDAFFPTSEVMREIFGKKGIDYGLEVRGRLLRRVSYFSQISYFHKDGRSIGGDYHTTMTLIPVSVGLLYHYYYNRLIDLYLGLGPSMTWSLNRNTFPGACILPNVKESMIGAVAKAGLRYRINPRYFAELFIDYNYCKIWIGDTNTNAISHALQVGGFRAGGGLGIAF